ncbi:MAG: family 10 glycosylhydrolase [Lachnospiraceae bacterium]|nr:family 10 glycosylhydrolase [Lachnospiraceae bacterium]
MTFKLIKKRIIASLTILATLITWISCAPVVSAASTNTDDMRGIWLSFNDYAKLGMSDVDEVTYIENVDAFLDTASSYNFNTVFLHVRSHDDAIWKSETFPASAYLTKDASRDVSAADTYDYDPLELFIQEAANYDIEVHAWLNPYRISLTEYLDPGKAANQKRVKKAVKELAKYDIAGIHFDDYFYHSQGGYVKNYKSKKVYEKNITPEKKRANVNKLVSSVYALCQKKDLVFGISPQGNYDNDMNSGADVLTWLTQEGYIDYLAPQIYWTNDYGPEGGTAMYTERLAQFESMHTNEAKMYTGLALYRCGVDFTYDHGWIKSNKNMKKQISEAKKAGWNGYIMFSAAYLYNKETAKERANLIK